MRRAIHPIIHPALIDLLRRHRLLKTLYLDPKVSNRMSRGQVHVAFGAPANATDQGRQSSDLARDAHESKSRFAFAFRATHLRCRANLNRRATSPIHTARQDC